MSTCDTCNYWQWPYEDNGFKHFCCNPKIGSRDVYAKDGAEIENRGEATGIITGAKFGCIHHEAK